MLAAAQIQSSMSRGAQPHDNAVMESFSATIKVEQLHTERYINHRQAEAAIFEYIEGFNNVTRIHSTNGGLNPDTYERAYHQAQQGNDRLTHKQDDQDHEAGQAMSSVHLAESPVYQTRFSPKG